MTIRVRAPASTANLGPGFDCAAVALDLWNELEVSEGTGVEVYGLGADDLPSGHDHLGVRAFGLLAPIEGRRFVFTNRIPLNGGLGSSAAVIALGLVAACAALGRAPDAEELLERGLELEGHADNLAAALLGGACAAWRADGEQRAVRLAESLPLVPIAVVPDARVDTSTARDALPETVPHADAAFTASRAVLLGAGLAGGSVDLLRAAFDDRLHQPFRGPLSPVFEPLRAELPSGAEAVTISGSGPTVIVWAANGKADACALELAGRFPSAHVLVLDVAAEGAASA